MRSKKALYSILSNIALQATIVISGFIVPKIIISTYGSDAYGLIASISQFLGYITLLESGFGPVVKAALYRPIARKDKNEIGNILKTTEKFFKIVALIFLFYILALCIAYPQIISSDFDRAYTVSLIAIIGISTFAEYFFGMTYGLFLQAKQKKYIISVVQILTYILSTVAVILLSKTGASIHIVKLISGAIFIFRPIFLNIYVKKKYKINLKQYDDNYKLEKKWDGLAQHIAYVIHTKTDITVLTIFTSLSEVSVYSVYFLVIRGIKALIGAFSGGIDASFGDMIAKNEKENLVAKFSMFETLHNAISTIAFTSAIVLIVPFVTVYMHDINDANYIRPLFGILIVISEYIWAIRQPYNSIILAAGHFRETRKGAWVECITNIVISVALVNWLGIIGVAIGTIVAMTVRAAEFIHHVNKYILKQSDWKSIKKILLVVIETIIITVICNFLPYAENNSYLNWGINALMVASIAGMIVLGFNTILFRKEMFGIVSLLKKFVPKQK